jgi:hypothetical protein
MSTVKCFSAMTSTADSPCAFAYLYLLEAGAPPERGVLIEVGETTENAPNWRTRSSPASSCRSS